MFTTMGRSRRRTGDQAAAAAAQREISPPPPGSDSTFGVRSLNGSVTWSPAVEGDHGGAMEGSSTREAVLNRSSDDSDHASFSAISSSREDQGGLDLDVMSGGGMDEDRLSTTTRTRDDQQRELTEEMDTTPVSLAPSPLLPDPFDTSSSSPRRAPGQSSTENQISPSAPIPVNGRIAHIGSGIMWGPSSPDETLHPLSLSTSSSTATGQGQGLASLISACQYPMTQPSPDPSYPASVWRYNHHTADGDKDDEEEEEEEEEEELFHRTLSNQDTGRDLPSEPSSPASFTSLPSYVGSMSSLSRTSSPISGISGPSINREFSDAVHSRIPPHYRDSSAESLLQGGEHLGHRSEELVIPMLSLPSSSLHLSLASWHGETNMIKVVLLGEVELAREVIRVLENRVQIVHLDKGGIGIVKNDKVVLSLTIASSVEQIRKTIHASYSALSRLLHPHPPKGSEGSVRRMISEHSRRALWVHLILNLGPDPIPQSLSSIAPVRHLAQNIPETSRPSEGPHDPAASPSSLDDPTPMPGSHLASSYFAASTTGDLNRAERYAQDLQELLENLPAVETQSIDTFLARRAFMMSSDPASSLEASITSADSGYQSQPHSGTSSHFDSHPPMPTVARASGGGEWEAGLSRRIAANIQRRERDDHHRSTRGALSRARPVKDRRVKRANCSPPPLFPISSAPIGKVSGARSSTIRTSLIWKTFGDIWNGLFGIWTTPMIISEPTGIPEPTNRPSAPPEDEVPPKRRRPNWRWRIGAAIVAVGVGIWLSNTKIQVSAHIKF
ncbi:hypothetical protein BD324DRAFT_370511 [Kockovaella imperatae]|uniref:Uncharacterized protein n=1 Tax=Kockovaella imperatae TaxID=4999 RepID=A0A1Y1UKP2_9TREE|nr:hypothetical protein BD324DRAFT_370511 [Kockovaella imperatae]ORX38623.1 hypothetical protein BD324DRAFT_370511 [Kockovaella imperatae]